jgi:hypothetical protein
MWWTVPPPLAASSDRVIYTAKTLFDYLPRDFGAAQHTSVLSTWGVAKSYAIVQNGHRFGASHS